MNTRVRHIVSIVIVVHTIGLAIPVGVIKGLVYFAVAVVIKSVALFHADPCQRIANLQFTVGAVVNGVQAFPKAAGGLPQAFVHTHRAANPTASDTEPTANGFGLWPDGSRIDWILCSPDLKVVDADIDHRKPGGRYPSDHYPVRARIDLR